MEKANTTSISKEDVMATLNRLSADEIVNAIKSCIEKDKDYIIYTSGGGMHNPLLMENIQSQMPGMKFFTTDHLQIHPDAKEAVLFALLANECICGEKIKMGKGRNKIPSVTMGKISFPE